jgi:hypothetical protein
MEIGVVAPGLHGEDDARDGGCARGHLMEQLPERLPGRLA